MRRIIIAVAGATAALAIAAGPAAAGTFCYDLQVNVNGDAVVSEAGCEELPV